MSNDFDDDDWCELEPIKKPQGGPQPDVSVRLSAVPSGVRNRVVIFFRGAVGDWIERKGPRFRIAVGGANANKLRILPDLQGGKYEAGTLKGVQRIMISGIPAWPIERRGEAAAAIATFTDDGNGLLLELPEDFAKRTAASNAKPAHVGVQPARKIDPAPSMPPVRTAAPGLEAQSRKVAQRSSVTLAVRGEPEPGRSEIDRRRAEAERQYGKSESR